MRADEQNMDSGETCADVQYAECEDAVGKRRRKTCSRAQASKSEQGNLVAVDCRVGGKYEGRRSKEKEARKKQMSHGMDSYKLMEERRLGAVSRTLPWVLPKKLKVYRSSVAQTDTVLGRLTLL